MIDQDHVLTIGLILGLRSGIILAFCLPRRKKKASVLIGVCFLVAVFIAYSC